MGVHPSWVKLSLREFNPIVIGLNLGSLTNWVKPREFNSVWLNLDRLSWVKHVKLDQMSFNSVDWLNLGLAHLRQLRRFSPVYSEFSMC